MKFLKTLFPQLFASGPEGADVDGATKVHQAIEELKTSTESLKRKIEQDEGRRPIRSSNPMGNMLADRRGL